MKFALVIIETSESRQSIQNDRKAHRDKLEAWMAEQAQAGVLVGGEAFETENTPPITVRTHLDAASEVIDGPFIDADESLGGYVLVEAADRDAAREIAKSWPASGEVLEVRPLWSPS